MQHKALSRTRRASVLGFTAGALVVTMTGSAFACTFYYGKLTVTARSPTNPLLVSSAFTDGAGGYSENVLEDGAIHGYCPLPSALDNNTDSGVSAAYPAQGMYKAAAFGLQVGRTTTCVKNNSLADADSTGVAGDATYDVRWLNMKNAASQICASSANDGVVESKGSIKLTAGAGSGVFQQGQAAAGDVVKVCIRPSGVTPSIDTPAAPDVKLLMM